MRALLQVCKIFSNSDETWFVSTLATDTGPSLVKHQASCFRTRTRDGAGRQRRYAWPYLPYRLLHPPSPGNRPTVALQLDSRIQGWIMRISLIEDSELQRVANEGRLSQIGRNRQRCWTLIKLRATDDDVLRRLFCVGEPPPSLPFRRPANGATLTNRHSAIARKKHDRERKAEVQWYRRY
jgi:hypothetical protein